MLDLLDEIIANEQDPVKYEKYNRRHKALRKVLFPDANAWWNE